MRVRLLIVAVFVAALLLAVSAAFGAGLLHETAADAQLSVSASDHVNVTRDSLDARRRPHGGGRRRDLAAPGWRPVGLRHRAPRGRTDPGSASGGQRRGRAQRLQATVVWTARRPGRPPQVRLLDAEVGHVTQLAAGADPVVGGATVAWVVRARGGDTVDVLDWVTDERAVFPAGGHVRDITAYGGWVAWTAKRGARTRLWSARLSRPGTRYVLGGGATALAMDARRTVWAVPSGAGHAELMAWDHKARHAVLLARVPGPVTSLTLSAGAIAWTRATAAGADIWRCAPAGGHATPVTQAPGNQVSPVFVGDTLYWADNGSGHWELCARTLTLTRSSRTCSGRDPTAPPRASCTLDAATRGGSMAVIEVHDLSKRFGKSVLAVDHVSFAIQAGSITGFLGPNGAGKTTTMRMILDLVRPTSGTAKVLGSRYRDLAKPATRVGALLDASGFHPGRSGRNALRVIAAAAGLPAARVDVALKLVELGRRGAARREKLLHGHAPAPGAGRRRCWATRRCCSWTSPPTAWTRKASAGCGAFCASAPPRAAPCWSPATCWPRWSRPWTMCSSSAPASCWRRVPSGSSRAGLRRSYGRAAPRPSAWRPCSWNAARP